MEHCVLKIVFPNNKSIKNKPIECKSEMAYIADNPDLYENMTAIDFINFICDMYKTPLDVRKENIKKYYIMLGLNEIILTTDEEFIGQYGEIIDRLKAAKPDCDIYIQSMMPISKQCEEDTSLTMEEINHTNELLEQLAEEKNCNGKKRFRKSW